VAQPLMVAIPRRRQKLLWGMHENSTGWTATNTNAMHWLHRSALKSARAWRLRFSMREVYARARQHNYTIFWFKGVAFDP